MDAQRVPAMTTPEHTIPAGGTSRRRLLRLTAASGGAVLVGTALARVAGRSPARAEAQEAQDGAGSWVAIVSYQGSPAGQVLLTFLAGGGLVQTTTMHPTRSPGLGAWAPSGDQALDFTYRAFNFDAT